MIWNVVGLFVGVVVLTFANSHFFMKLLIPPLAGLTAGLIGRARGFLLGGILGAFLAVMIYYPNKGKVNPRELSPLNAAYLIVTPIIGGYVGEKLRVFLRKKPAAATAQ